MQVRSSVRLMPQNQQSSRGLLLSPTAWLPDQHHAAMLADVSRHSLGRTGLKDMVWGNNNNNINNNNNCIQRGYLRFFTISQRRELSLNTHAQVAQAQSYANHVQHIECLSHAACHVTCHLVRRDSSAIKFDRVEIAFI